MTRDPSTSVQYYSTAHAETSVDFMLHMHTPSRNNAVVLPGTCGMYSSKLELVDELSERCWDEGSVLDEPCTRNCGGQGS